MAELRDAQVLDGGREVRHGPRPGFRTSGNTHTSFSHRIVTHVKHRWALGGNTPARGAPLPSDTPADAVLPAWGVELVPLLAPSKD